MAVVAYEEVAVTAGAAVALNVPPSARKALLQPSVDVRVRTDGTPPTSSVGTKVPTDSMCELCEGEAESARFRAETSTGVLRVHYYA